MSRKSRFSNWRDDCPSNLSEYVSAGGYGVGYGVPDLKKATPRTQAQSEKEITEKPVRNKVVINPNVKEAIEEINGVILEFVELTEKEVDVKDTRRTVDAIRAYDRSKDASRDATYDTDHGKKKKGDKEKAYAKKERGEIRKDDPNWKNRKYHTGMHGEAVETNVDGATEILPGKKSLRQKRNARKSQVYAEFGEASLSATYAANKAMTDHAKNNLDMKKTSSGMKYAMKKADERKHDGYATGSLDNASKRSVARADAAKHSAAQERVRKSKMSNEIGSKGGKDAIKKYNVDKAAKISGDSNDRVSSVKESASNPFQVHFDKDGKSYTDKGSKRAAERIRQNVAANRKKGPMKYDPYKGTDGRD